MHVSCLFVVMFTEVMPKGQEKLSCQVSFSSEKKRNQIPEINTPLSFTDKSLYLIQTQFTYILLSKPFNWFQICGV